MNQSCPLCRKALSPGPEMLFDLGYGELMKITDAIDRSRPGVDWRTPWPPLSTKQQYEMNQAVAMLREAVDQGHRNAQGYCGDVYCHGHGVEKDVYLSFLYYEKSAKQGWAMPQYNLAGFVMKRVKGSRRVMRRRASGTPRPLVRVTHRP